MSATLAYPMRSQTYPLRPALMGLALAAAVVAGSIALTRGKGVAPAQADFNGSGLVDFEDFFLFAGVFGRGVSEEGYEPKFDMDRSGRVDFEDFFMFAEVFGKTALEGVEKDGIAARYPGDAGIERDSSVVFVEDFEEASLDELKGRWESVSSAEIMSFSDDVHPGSAGKRSLLMSHVGGRGNGGHLYRRLSPGYERLHVRFYVKFDPQCNPIHHFFHVGGYNPSTPWPQGGAGERPRGDDRFSTGVEPYGNSWVWDYYTYWMEMRGSPPQGQTWGNSFVRDPGLKAERGKWVCAEVMMKMNDVGEANGEMALWIEGKLISHLGKGFPKGRWTYDKFLPGEGGEGIRWSDEKGGPERFTVPAGGAPFEGFRWRRDERLKLNFLWVLLYITTAPQGLVSKVWFDHIVVARQYIGPLSQ